MSLLTYFDNNPVARRLLEDFNEQIAGTTLPETPTPPVDREFLREATPSHLHWVVSDDTHRDL